MLQLHSAWQARGTGPSAAASVTSSDLVMSERDGIAGALASDVASPGRACPGRGGEEGGRLSSSERPAQSGRWRACPVRMHRWKLKA